MAIPALEGGKSVRNTFLPFHLPTLEQEEISAVTNVLRGGWLTKGPETLKLEENVKHFVGTKHAIGVNSCTSALHLSLETAGISVGDEVIVPTYTFAATANVVIHAGAKPVLVDVDSDNFCINIAAAEKAISKRTKAIVPVHFAGHPCEMDLIQELARKHNLEVIEDAAHAFGAKYKGKMIGGLSKYTCFSFYVTKNITTGEGGMITTDDDEMAEKLRTSSMHGLNADAWNRYSNRGSWYYEVVNAGYKYNMSDLQAALGNVQLLKVQRFQESRETIAKKYVAELSNSEPIIVCPRPKSNVKSAWHLFPIILRFEKLRLNRDKFIQALKAEQIGTSVHFIPVHMHPYYAQTYSYRETDFPNSYFLFSHEISLPIYPNMTENDVMDVISALKKLVSYYKK